MKKSKLLINGIVSSLVIFNIIPVYATIPTVNVNKAEDESNNKKWETFLFDAKYSNTTDWVFDRYTDSYYYFVDGELQTNKFINENGIINYVDTNGKRAMEWTKITDNGIENWYYFDNNAKTGGMTTGWLKDIDGRWYYFNTNGIMMHDTIVDGCKLGSDGSWIK